MALVLDLGCGAGGPPLRSDFSPGDDVTGVDIDEARLALARQRFPQRAFLCARGESLPFADVSFDRVVSGVALPYMDIPRTLAEVRRILKPRGSVMFSLHPLHFTLGEFSKAVPRPIATGFRLFVVANGLYFHLTGRILRVAGKTESFQTRRGLRLALVRAGFESIEFKRPEGRLIVEAKIPCSPNRGDLFLSR
jgi:ubiquinone/menaquinone biosynthesis C-methylase UbiE